MLTLTVVLLSFVGLWAGGCATYVIITDPEDEIDFLKRWLKFENEEIYDRWLKTEELTCNEVGKVLQTMKDNMRSDLELLLVGAKKHLESVPPPGNKQQRRCIEYIKEDIEVAISEGLDHFSRCTKTSEIIQKEIIEDLGQERGKYEENVAYTLQNLDSCLRYSSESLNFNRNECILKKVKINLDSVMDVYDIFNNSKCMCHFTTSILNCATSVFDKIASKNKKIREDIYTCLGYSFEDEDKGNFGEIIMNILSAHTNAYKLLDNEYHYMMEKYSLLLYYWSMKKGNNLEQQYHDELRERFQSYFDSLNKTMNDNWSEKEKQCTINAASIIEDTIKEESHNYAECYGHLFEQGNEVMGKIKTEITKFNEMLTEAGNVALLKCFGQRPQQVFDYKIIHKCADLARRNISVELLSLIVNNKLDKVRTMFLTEFERNPCGLPSYERLVLAVDRTMYDCERCLYGANGNYYAVTTPPVYFTQPYEATSYRPEETEPDTTVTFA